jgi:hypothetical protein
MSYPSLSNPLSSDILNKTNPNIVVQVANRTFGGTSSAHSSSIVNGVKGGSYGLASATYLNKGYSYYEMPQKAYSTMLNTKNLTTSTLANGCFIKNNHYGRILDSNVSGPKSEPLPTGATTNRLVNPNSVYAQKGTNLNRGFAY